MEIKHFLIGLLRIKLFSIKITDDLYCEEFMGNYRVMERQIQGMMGFCAKWSPVIHFVWINASKGAKHVRQ